MFPTSREQMDEWVKTLGLCASLLAPQSNQAHYNRVVEVAKYIRMQQDRLYSKKEVPLA